MKYISRVIHVCICEDILSTSETVTKVSIRLSGLYAEAPRATLYPFFHLNTRAATSIALLTSEFPKSFSSFTKLFIFN